MSAPAPTPAPAPRGRRPNRAAGGTSGPGLRSPFVRRVLTAASVTALTVLVGVITEVLTGTLSDSPLGQTLVPLLDRFGWLAVPVLVLFVAAPLAAAIRERSHGVDPAILSGELVGPGPEVDAPAAKAPQRLDRRATMERFKQLDPGERLLIRSLATLPGVPLSADAILAVNHAVRTGFGVALQRARIRFELTGNPAEQLENLVGLRLVARPETAMYQLTCDVELATGEEPSLVDGHEQQKRFDQATRHACALGLPAVLAHYADLGNRWASALGSEAYAKYASRWFRLQAPTLHKLVVACEPDEDQRKSTIDALAVIGDALDVWYTREQDPENALEIANVLVVRARQTDRPTLRELAVARAAAASRAKQRQQEGQAAGEKAASGDETEAEPTAVNQPSVRERLRPLLRRLRAVQVFRPAGLRARELHEEAMLALDAWGHDPKPDDLDAIERKLTDAWFTLPRADVAGEVTTLINLAVVYLHQGRFEAAQDRLELAEALTESGRDAGGRAHALELHGVTAWALGRTRPAVRYWERARELYEQLGESAGNARCLQHLGSALVVEARLGGLVIEPPADDQPEGQPPVISREEIWRRAESWLSQAADLRAGGEPRLAEEYLGTVRKQQALAAKQQPEQPVRAEARQPDGPSGTRGQFGRFGDWIDALLRWRAS